MVDIPKQNQSNTPPPAPQSEILVQPPFSNGAANSVTASVTNTAPFTQQIAGDIGYGSFFTGTIANEDLTNVLDLIIVDRSTPTTYQIPAGYVLNLVNARCVTLQIAPDPNNSGASIKFVMNGSVRIPLTPKAADELVRDAQIFFRKSTVLPNTTLAGSGIAIVTIATKFGLSQILTSLQFQNPTAPAFTAKITTSLGFM